MKRRANIYPEDAILTGKLNGENLDVISRTDTATLDEMFRERVRRSPEVVAYQQFDESQQEWFTISWAELASQVERWQVAFREEGLEKGDRVAICHKNSIEWVIFDQAALRLGLVVVPLYTADRVENISYVLHDSDAKLVLFTSLASAKEVLACDDQLNLIRALVMLPFEEQTSSLIRSVDSWLPEQGQHFDRGLAEPDDLASIVYTSGTTGRPKGVMLSHRNILSNSHNGMRSVVLKTTDCLLSFLPLSHALERTIGYYAPLMCGACVTFSRSIPQLAEDLLEIKPTVLITVPRIFERIHNKIYATVDQSSWIKKTLFSCAINVGWHQFEYSQHRRSWHPKLLFFPILTRLVAKPVCDILGGQLTFAIVGGAALSPVVAKTFISLGINLLQGYGLTESSPVLTVNTLDHNSPDSIGLPLSDISLKIEEGDELWAKGESIMQGYWGKPDATAETMQGEWLKTGDRASIDDSGYVRIIGRIKEIIVLANGEKVPPNDIEQAIVNDPLFEQVMVVGEGKSYLAVLVVLNNKKNNELFKDRTLSSDAVQEFLLERIAKQMEEFPGYAKIRRVFVVPEPWTVEGELLTPTLKIKRTKILEKYQRETNALYEGHGVRST